MIELYRKYQINKYRKFIAIHGSPILPWQHETKCIFIHIPKCAGTSVLQYFGHKGARAHARSIDYKKFDSKSFSEYYKFTIVRKPLSRLYSTYQYLRRGGNGSWQDKSLAKSLNVSQDFASFVKNGLSESVVKNELLFWEQSSFIFDDDDTLQVDLVCRVENLSNDFKVIAERFGKAASLSRVNESISSKGKDLGGESVKDKVRELYDRDYVNILKYYK